MGNAGRNGGEYYTPRPLIRAIVKVVQPKIGERIYDGACGSAGFLCESFDYLKSGTPGNANLPIGGPKEARKGTAIQANHQRPANSPERTFYGKEKKSLAYVIAIMNMILHGIEAPNIIHTNTLTENLADYSGERPLRSRYGKSALRRQERKEVQQNFPSARAKPPSSSSSTSSKS